MLKKEKKIDWLSALKFKNKKTVVLPYYISNKDPSKKRQDPFSITDDTRGKHTLIRFMGNLEDLL